MDIILISILIFSLFPTSHCLHLRHGSNDGSAEDVSDDVIDTAIATITTPTPIMFDNLLDFDNDSPSINLNNDGNAHEDSPRVNKIQAKFFPLSNLT